MLCVRYPYSKKNLKKNQCILDIETTGLDPNFDSLVVLGLIYFDKNKDGFYIDQYFTKNDEEEIKLLEIYTDKIRNKILITYNGIVFDIPFLNIRLTKYKLKPVFPENKDLYKTIKSKRKLIRFESMKLVDVEKFIGIERNDPSRYKVISKLNDDIKDRDKPWPILEHNKNDLIATERLSNIENLINDRLSFEIKDYKIFLNKAYIDKDLACIEFISNKFLIASLFQGPNYTFSIKNKTIKLKIMVLYGKLSKNSSGYVSVNNFNITNKGKYKINENLITIMEDRIFVCENILAIMKKIIKENLDL